jgi:hypothetical protein
MVLTVRQLVQHLEQTHNVQNVQRMVYDLHEYDTTPKASLTRRANLHLDCWSARSTGSASPARHLLHILQGQRHLSIEDVPIATGLAGEGENSHTADKI